MLFVAIIGSAGLVLTTFLVALVILTRVAGTIHDPQEFDCRGLTPADLQRTIDEHEKSRPTPGRAGRDSGPLG